MDDDQTIKDLLSPDHYRVHVRYAGIPPMEELKTIFVEPIPEELDISGSALWETHACAIGTDETPGDRVFWLADPPQEIRTGASREKVIAWGVKQGYYPATPQEGLDFTRGALAVPLSHRRIMIPGATMTLVDSGMNTGILPLVIIVNPHKKFLTFFKEIGFDFSDPISRFLFVRK